LKKKSRNKRRKAPRILLGGEKDYFAENLSMLLSAGIGVSAAIAIMAEGSSNKSYKKLLTVINSDLDEGSSLWKALEGRGIFNHSYLYMTKVGEESGRLSENLSIIAEQQKKSKSFKSKLTSALIYPGIILSLTLIIGIAVIWFVIPKMAKIFGDMKIDLPLPTRIMINLGNFITDNPILFLSLIFISLGSFILFFFIPGTKRVGQAILFRTPRIKNLFKEVEVARFGYVMYSLAQAGIPLTEAIQSIERSTQFSLYRKFYHYLFQSIADGNSLEKSFHKYKNLKRLLPINIQQMIIAGERSGNLVTVLGKISGIYEEKIDTTSKNISVILEPLLLFVVWLGVLFLALAVIMPIYGLVGGLDGA
jgi:type IV pilus assembly protein PilC